MQLVRFLKQIFKHKISIIFFLVLPMTVLFIIILFKFVSAALNKTAHIKEERVIYLYEQTFEDESYKKEIFSAHNVSRSAKFNYLHPTEFNKKAEIVFKVINFRRASSFYIIPKFILFHKNTFFKLLISQDNEEYQLLFSRDGSQQFYYGSPMIKLSPFDGHRFIKAEMYVDKQYAKELWDVGLLSVEFFAKNWTEKRYKSPNIVLFVIDTLRADHLSSYGYKRKTTPNIDRFCKEGALFYNAFSQANHTIPSIASLITSRYSSDALEYSNKNKPFNFLGAQARTLAEILRVNGYKTASFVANQLLGKGNRGFYQGYDSYNYVPPQKADTKRSGRAKAVNQMASEWLLKNSKEKFFLYIHTMDAHAPYVPVPPYNHIFDPDYTGDLLMTDINQKCLLISRYEKEISDRDLEYLISLYDGEIRYADYYFHEFIVLLDKLNLLDDTLIIVTADHGEQFYEHGMQGHGFSMHEEEIHVPLIMRYPKKIPKNKKIYHLVELMGIAPTILDVLEINIPRGFKGKSLLGLLSGNKREDDYVICSEGMHAVSLAIRNKKYKFIKLEKITEDVITNLGIILSSPGGRELYDLVNDPAEKFNIYSYNLNIAKKLEKKLNNRLNMKQLQSPILDRKHKVPPQIIDQLKALGYIQ